jgi:disulfide bond formation protein DsbB
MTKRNGLILLAAGGSLAMLLGAFAFQYIGGLLPCVLCLWQRWPPAAAVLLGVLGISFGGRVWPVLGAVAALTTAAIGVFHVGVEQTWWEGLASCTVNALEGVSAGDLLNTDVTVGGPVRCDAIAWSMLGVSMAGWNAIVSVGLAGLWVAAARKT